jgi:hypothetical protein
MKNRLTALQAFQAMTDFFDMHYRYSHSDQIGALLGAMDMNIFGNGHRTADPAIWEDWIECLNNNTALTVLEAFQAARQFVEMRYALEPDDTVVALTHGMHVRADGTIENPAIWEDWMCSVNKVLERGIHGI